MKNWIVLLLFACLAACTDRTGYVVKGVFEGAGDGCAVLKFGDDSPGIDTVRMKGGRFEFEGHVAHVCMAMVEIIPEGKKSIDVQLVLENKRLELRGEWESIGYDKYGMMTGLQISGSTNNDLLQKLNAQYGAVRELPEFYGKEHSLECYERIRQEQLNIIMDNLSMEISVSWFGMLAYEMALSEVERIFGLFDVKVQESEMAKHVREHIELRRRIEPGQLAPDFTLAQRDSLLISLSDFRGKVVVLDFWASSCGPCRRAFSWMRDFYKEYQEKGVEIIGVSVDRKKANWEKALDEEKLPWIQVIDDSRMERLYHVWGVPKFFIVDREGKIVLHGHLEQEEVTATVEKVLKK